MTELDSLMNIGPTPAAGRTAVDRPDAQTRREVGAGEAAPRLAAVALPYGTHAAWALSERSAGWTGTR
jgi:hypothetical protein